MEVINQRRKGVKTAAKAPPKTGGNVINLMDALKRSLASEKQSAPAAAKETARETAKAKGKKPKKAASGQREMLLPISGGGKRPANETAQTVPKKSEKPVRAPGRSKKAR